MRFCLLLTLCTVAVSAACERDRLPKQNESATTFCNRIPKGNELPTWIMQGFRDETMRRTLDEAYRRAGERLWEGFWPEVPIGGPSPLAGEQDQSCWRLRDLNPERDWYAYIRASAPAMKTEDTLNNIKTAFVVLETDLDRHAVSIFPEVVRDWNAHESERIRHIWPGRRSTTRVPISSAPMYETEASLKALAEELVDYLENIEVVQVDEDEESRCLDSGRAVLGFEGTQGNFLPIFGDLEFE